MPSEQSKLLAQRYQTLITQAHERELPLPVTRAYMDSIHLATAEPTNVTYEQVQCPGTVDPAIWCKPVGASNKTVILYFHGGGFFTGSPSSYRKLVGHLAKASRTLALVTDYRKTPEAQFPLQLEDAVESYRWLLARGYDSQDIVLAGDSAGGNLVVGTLSKLKENGVPLPGALVLFSPWLDMELGSNSYEENATKDVLITKQSSILGRGMWLGSESEKNGLANPFYANMSECPPTYIAVGTVEALRDDSIRFSRKLKDEGVDVELELAEDMQHVHVLMAGNAPEADNTLENVGVWLKTKLTITGQA